MLEPKSIVNNEAELRQIIGPVVNMAQNKKLPVLEDVSKHFIQHSPFLSMCTRQPNGYIDISGHGGQPGFVKVLDEQTLLIPYYSDERQSDILGNIESNPHVGLIFLIPIVNETLRINGQAKVIQDKEFLARYLPDTHELSAGILVKVSENYLHCAKAFLRSKLWDTSTYDLAELAAIFKDNVPIRLPELDETCQTFIRHSPFLFLGSQAEEGADVSPRGDPRGFAYIVNNKTLLIPDRPGNRIADNFRNIMVNPEVGLMFFIPGADWILSISGQATIFKDPELLELLAVQGKAPSIGLWIDIMEVFMAPSKALVQAKLWEPQVRINRKEFPTLGQMMAQQLKFAGTLGEETAESLDDALQEAYTKRLY